jgi:hypothetical protein
MGMNLHPPVLGKLESSRKGAGHSPLADMLSEGFDIVICMRKLQIQKP